MEVYESGVTAKNVYKDRKGKKPELEERRFENTLYPSHVQAPISLLFACRVEARAETAFYGTCVLAMKRYNIAVERNARLSCGNSLSDMDLWTLLVLFLW